MTRCSPGIPVTRFGGFRPTPGLVPSYPQPLAWDFGQTNGPMTRDAEDTALIAGVQAGMSSSSYVSGPLSPAEPCLAAFADRLRAAIPEAALHRPPTA